MVATETTAAAAAPAAKKTSLFDKLGGPEAVRAAVDVFYGKIMADEALVPFFEGVNMAKQKMKQVGLRGRSMCRYVSMTFSIHYKGLHI